MKILQVQNLVKQYGKGDTTVNAVNNVSFDVEEGEFVVIVGASGSGKSTLLHLLGGVDKATKGSIQLCDQEITTMNGTQSAIFRRQNIGLIYQFYNLIPVLNVQENVELPLKLDHKNPNPEKCLELLKLLSLEDRLKHLPSELSGGQQQRVAIARAIICNPAIILADEPTGNLDKENSKEVIAYLAKINKEQKQTIILVTHDLEIAKYASRVITMEDGKIIKENHYERAI